MSISPFEKPRAVDVQFSNRRMIVRRDDGSSADVPLDWFPRLNRASTTDLADWRFIGRGMGIRWEKLDEDLLVDPMFHPTECADPSFFHLGDEPITLEEIGRILQLTRERLSAATTVSVHAQTDPSYLAMRNDPEEFVRQRASR